MKPDSYEFIEARNALENLDNIDSKNLFFEMVLNLGQDQIIEWLNDLEDMDREGYKVRVLDSVGHVVG